jgi:hypothetical protein
MNKKYFNIFLTLIVIIIFGMIIYQGGQNNKNNIINNNPNEIPVWSSPDQDGWVTTTDCRNIKLYLWDGKNPSEAGLEDEQDIAGDPEKKILSIGLPESIYGPRKRLEISYAKPSDYENCSPDVKRLIDATIHL